MALNPSLTELTTAVTDLMVALLSVWSIVMIYRHRANNKTRVRIWLSVFTLLVTASILGAIAHGFDFSQSTLTWLWRPLYLLLGVIVALFVVGSIYDLKGETAATYALPPLLVLAIGFFLVTEFLSDVFLIFIIYEAVAMLSALIIYLSLTISRQLNGSAIVATGILLNILAAGIQASTLSLSLGVPLDHNGVFHIVQLLALYVLTMGLVRGMQPHIAE